MYLRFCTTRNEIPFIMLLLFRTKIKDFTNIRSVSAVLSAVTLIKRLFLAKNYRKRRIVRFTGHFFICYLTGDSNRSVIWHFRPWASFSRVQIVGFEFSFIHSWIDDFDTPDISEACRIDNFFWYIILSNNIFILLVFIVSDKICINIYNKKRGG